MKNYIKIFLAIAATALVFSCTVERLDEEPYLELGGETVGISEGNPFWDWADKYPGVVDLGIERVNDIEVNVRGGYEPFAFAPDTMALQSTGLYVPSCEIITIDVPEGVDKLKYQIGIGHPLSPGQQRIRYTDVTNRGYLKPGENRLQSYFGGFLYFGYDPKEVPQGDVTVTVSGCCQSDNYIVGETNAFEWGERMRERARMLYAGTEDPDSLVFLRWAEMISDKTIVTVGVRDLYKLEDPSKIMAYFDEWQESYYEWAGLEINNQMPLRVASDIQMPDIRMYQDQIAWDGAYRNTGLKSYGQYPLVYARSADFDGTNFDRERDLLHTYYIKGEYSPDKGNNWMERLLAVGDIFLPEFQKGKFIYWPLLKLSQYHHVEKYGRIHGGPIDFIVQFGKLSHTNANRFMQYNTMDKDKLMPLMCRHNNYAGTDARTTMIKLLENEYGYGLFPYLCQRERELGYKFQLLEDGVIYDGQTSYDFLAMGVCEYANRNILPYFDLYDFPVSQQARQYCQNFQELSEEEIFWKEFDMTYIPAFDTRTPNKSFERPAQNFTYYLTPTSVTSGWYISARLLKYEDFQKGKRTVCVKADVPTPKKFYATDDTYHKYATKISGDNDLNRLVDNKDNITHVLGDSNSKAGAGAYCNLPELTFWFTGPDETERDPNDTKEYNTTPITFNSMAVINQAYSGNPQFCNHISDIEYWDMEQNKWMPCTPGDFKLYKFALYYVYFFDRTYTTTKVRMILYPGSGTGERDCKIREINFGMTIYADDPEAEVAKLQANGQ